MKTTSPPDEFPRVDQGSSGISKPLQVMEVEGAFDAVRTAIVSLSDYDGELEAGVDLK
jgi:hypothetical protein